EERDAASVLQRDGARAGRTPLARRLAEADEEHDQDEARAHPSRITGSNRSFQACPAEVNCALTGRATSNRPKEGDGFWVVVAALDGASVPGNGRIHCSRRSAPPEDVASERRKRAARRRHGWQHANRRPS